jgi:DNA-directed RNA polymerase specialized sigma24 family protein
MHPVQKLTASSESYTPRLRYQDTFTASSNRPGAIFFLRTRGKQSSRRRRFRRRRRTGVAHLSKDEFREALLRLSETELAQLKEVADVLAVGLRSYDGDDLLQDACLRTLQGERRCPRGRQVSKYLYYTMLWIKLDRWKEENRRSKRDLKFALQQLDNFNASQRDLQDDVVLRRGLQKILQLSSDPIDQRIILDLLQGNPPMYLQGKIDRGTYVERRYKICCRVIRHWESILRRETK